MSVCRSCGAPIRWVTIQPGGKKMPLDAEPTPDGNVIVDAQGLAVVLAKRDEPRLQDPGEPAYYTSHFATCPQADDWRSR